MHLKHTYRLMKSYHGYGAYFFRCRHCNSFRVIPKFVFWKGDTDAYR